MCVPRVCHLLLLEALKDILHVVPLGLQTGLVTDQYIQLPPQVGEVVFEERLQVAPGTFLFL